MPKLSLDDDLWLDRFEHQAPEVVKAAMLLLIKMRRKKRVTEIYMSTAYSKDMRNCLATCFYIDPEGYWHYPCIDRMNKTDQGRGLNASKKQVENKLKTTRKQVENNTITKTVKKTLNPKKEATKQNKIEALKRSKLFPIFNEIYFNWFEARFDVKPDFDASDGKALKNIIKWVTSNNTKGEPEDAFRYILNNWERLDDFTQKKTRMRDISSNLNSIITQLKNGQSNSGNRIYSQLLDERFDQDGQRR